MPRTQARVSRSLKSTLVRSLTAFAIAERTLAESASYCCAPASSCVGEASAALTASAASLAAGRRIGEARAHEGHRLGERHLGRGGVAAMLVLGHALRQPAFADHDTVGNTDELLVGEQHAGALVAIV